MSETASNAPSLPVESKSSAKKRKSKTDATPTSSTPSPQAQDPAVNGTDNGAGESPHLKELNKQIRNVHKKLAGSSKTESIIAENPGISLDQLVSSKKINSDQKAQVLKRPALEAQLAQLEGQVTQFRTFGQYYETRFAEERAALQTSHEVELNTVKQHMLEQTTLEVSGKLAEKYDRDLLLLSQFLHAAAAKRQTDDADTPEGRAYEGVLLLAYQGNSTSLETLQNFVQGSSRQVPDTHGHLLDFTFAELRRSAIESAPPLIDPDELDNEDSHNGIADGDLAEASTSDPTIANAGLTELEDTTTIRIKSSEQTTDLPSGIEQASVGGEAANALADASWDPQASIMTIDSATRDEWVEVPRDPTETDTGLTATPAATHGTSNWAEEVTEGAAAAEKAAVENDGFEQVMHNPSRVRGRGRGEYRGRGGRGDRGDRVDRGDRGGRGRGDYDGRRGGRGRGRGGDGNHRGGHRGGRGAPASGDTGAGAGW